MIKLFLIAAVLGMSACSKVQKPATDKIEPGDTTTAYQAVFKVDSGWDIYTQGVYRYGPSIIRNADGSHDAWFAAPGDLSGERTYLYDEAAAQSPVALNTGHTAAQSFTVTDSFYSVAVPCPAWGSSNSSLTMSLYRWNTDYANTVAAQPLLTQSFPDYADNQYLQLAATPRLPKGTYCWVLSDPAGTAGVWKKEAEVAGVINWLDGQTVSGSYQSLLMYHPQTTSSFWDQVAYRHSSDGGKTWTSDQLVLIPTQGSRDQLSVCDPGVVKSGNYYYIGYTSTEDPGGVYNHAYVARSKTATGPWEKWNGSGWGGNPQPVIAFNGTAGAWGAGEPCMIVNNDTLFFYYSWNDQTVETRVATASASDSLWPAHLQLHPTAIDKTSIGGADHCDVKYRDDLKKYYAIHTASRLTASSYIVLWESSDGLAFHKIAELRDHLKPYLHNCGWSGDEKGHINPGQQQYLSYAYGPNWASWNTAWHPITFQP